MPLKLRDPTATRPWQHVLDPLSGYLLLAQRLHDSDNVIFQQSFNFGPKSEVAYSVSEVVDKISHLWRGDVIFSNEQSHYKETSRLSINIDLAVNVLGWRPKWNLDRALDETIKWYQTVFDCRDSFDLTISQIQAFEKNT